MSAHTPGPWGMSEWSGGEGYLPGFYVSRQANGRTEWLKTGAGKVLRFKTEENANRAIASANFDVFAAQAKTFLAKLGD